MSLLLSMYKICLLQEDGKNMWSYSVSLSCLPLQKCNIMLKWNKSNNGLLPKSDICPTVTYVDNCLTWLIVKTILFGVNIGGSGLWSCSVLSMALMAGSTTTKKWLAVGKKNLLNYNDLFFLMDCAYVGTSHNNDFFPPLLLPLQLTSWLPF